MSFSVWAKIHGLAESSNFDSGLFLCSNGKPGSLSVILPAMVGRLCLDICFTTIYVGLVENFSESAQMTVLPACNLAFEFFCACKLTYRLQGSVRINDPGLLHLLYFGDFGELRRTCNPYSILCDPHWLMQICSG